jgi:MoxR-like ATPase
MTDSSGGDQHDIGVPPLPDDNDVRLFFAPASGKAAQEHVRLSLSRPIAPDLSATLSSEILERASNDGLYYAWGARPGARNDLTWLRMRAGDYVVFYVTGLYQYIARVKVTVRSTPTAEQIWGLDPGGASWELIYFLTPPQRIDVPLETLSDTLQAAPYQGFVELPEARVAKVVATYGSVEEFVARRFFDETQTPTNFVLLRSNESSPWQDDATGSYHYGRTVPNHKRLRIGTAAVFDRKEASGNHIFGSGRVTEIAERNDGTFDAKFLFEPLQPRSLTEYELSLLRAQPGYNVQHAIRPISPELFDSLTGSKSVGISAIIDDDPPDAVATRLSWSVQRAEALLSLARRANALLFAGPPGTGKTFVARILAEALTSDPSQRRIVQFHPAYQYEDFIQGIRPTLDGGRLQYEMHRGVLLTMAARASEQPRSRFVLILDELNRGNVARIFGELIYAIEYRGKENALLLSSGEDFYMPANLLIIATMNTADQSIIGLDAALRRRFHQQFFGPDYDALRKYLTASHDDTFAEDVVGRLERLNEELVATHGDPAKVVGHSYFMQPKLTDASIQQVWDEQLQPLLNDFLYDRPDEVRRLATIITG